MTRPITNAEAPAADTQNLPFTDEPPTAGPENLPKETFDIEIDSGGVLVGLSFLLDYPRI